MLIFRPEMADGAGEAFAAQEDDHLLVWLRLLGGFRLISEGHPVPVRNGGKTEALLVHLALAGLRGVARDVLLRVIWPHSEPSLAGQALNSRLRELKALLGDALRGANPVVLSAGQYRLNQDAGLTVDVVQFQALVHRGERLQRENQLIAASEVYERAVALYEGDLSLAAGSSGRAALERERLRATYRRILIRLADAAFACGAFDQAREHALALLDHDPCREDAHRLVMRCHVKLGERSQALHHYHTMTDVLRAELDAGPEPVTTALFEQIRVNPGAI